MIFSYSSAFRVSMSYNQCRKADLTQLRAEFWLARYYSSNTVIFTGKNYHFILDGEQMLQFGCFVYF